jgi:hypothetical protein
MIVYLVSAAGTALLAFGSTRDPDIPYWRRDRMALSSALGWIYSIYALVGAFVALLGEHAHLHPVSNAHGGEWVNGAIYAFVAALLLRWDAIPFLAPTTAPAKTLVTVFLGRFTQRLDGAAATAIDRKVGDLPPDDLFKLALRVFRKYVANRALRGELPPRIAKNDYRRLLERWERVRTAEPIVDSDLDGQEIAAIEFLRDYVSEILIRERDGTTYIGRASRDDRARCVPWRRHRA